MEYKPLHDNVLILPDPVETKTAGGVLIPETAQSAPKQGKVIAVGPGKKGYPMELKPGDVVKYGHYAGTEIDVDGVIHLIMKEDQVFVVLY